MASNAHARTDCSYAFERRVRRLGRTAFSRGVRTAFVPLAAACGLVFTASAAAGELFRDPQFTVQTTLGIVYHTAEVAAPMPGDFSLLLDLYQPVGPGVPEQLPGMVLIHGGGFSAGSREQLHLVETCTRLAARGYVCVSIDHRLLGQMPVVSAEFQQVLLELAGPSPTELANTIVAALEDTTNAHRWMVSSATALKLDPTRIAVGGFSAGATLAPGVAYALDDHGLLAVPDVAASVCMWGFVLQTSVADMETGEAPLIVIHGADDAVAPVADAENLIATAASLSVPNELHVIPGAGHGFDEINIFTVEASPGVTLFDRIVEFLYVELALAEPPVEVPTLGGWGPALLFLSLIAVALRSVLRSRTDPFRDH